MNNTTVWFITGTSSGLGKALAEKVLTQEHAVVHGIGRHHVIAHPRYIAHQADLSDLSILNEFVFPAVHAQRIVLINNAGRLGEIAYGGKLQADDIANTYTVNTIAPHILCNQFIASYQAHDAKKIVINITSGAAQHPYDGWSVYCASKAAMDMFTKSLAAEQREAPHAHGILFFAIGPGVMDTAMQTHIRNADESNFSRQKKFVDLWQNAQLYSTDRVATWFLEFTENCDETHEIIQRVVL